MYPTSFFRKTGLIAVFILSQVWLAASADRPNIIWILAEDTSPWMGCYGDTVNQDYTPNIDSIAKRGILFTRAYVPAPVCSAARSALMAGQNSIRVNSHEHRSSRSKEHQITLPREVKLLPQIMKENGYYTFNVGKTDYNYIWDEKATYDMLSGRGSLMENDGFAKLKKNQPFFGQIQTGGGKTNTNNMEGLTKTSPEEVTVPLDYPDNQLYREVVAQHYDAIRKEDHLVGQILKGLEDAGLMQNTIVVYFSDHGANRLVRHKQMCTEGGLHVPFLMMGPDRYVPTNVKKQNDLVDMLDISATTLAWAGIDIPKRYEGQNLFGKSYQPRKFVASQKDRLDHTIDRVRTIRTDRFRYVRNFKTDRIFLQPQYRDKQDYTQNLHQLYAENKLSPVLKKIYFGERPAEELYDVVKDPAMVNDLANDPAYADELKRHRKLLAKWLAAGDYGEKEEPIAELKDNGDDRKWGIGVNPEYEVYRKDSDGDGLSDIWEKANGRDPEDGWLHFEFNCGGHQTEGWQPDGINNNIAGYLGFLDFTLESGKGSLVRKGLKATATSGDQAIEIVGRFSKPLTLKVRANGKIAGTIDIPAKRRILSTSIPLNQNVWKGSIKSLELEMSGPAGAFVEIDAIRVLK